MTLPRKPGRAPSRSDRRFTARVRGASDWDTPARWPDGAPAQDLVGHLVRPPDALGPSCLYRACEAGSLCRTWTPRPGATTPQSEQPVRVCSDWTSSTLHPSSWVVTSRTCRPGHGRSHQLAQDQEVPTADVECNTVTVRLSAASSPLP